SPPTPKAGLDAALVYCGYGFPEDFASAHAKGAIVLVLRGRAWLREKAANAAAAGALGLVVFDPERTEFQGTLLAPASIPCAAIGGAEGRALQGRLEAGERIRAHFVVDSSIENGKSRNLIARLPGSRGGKPVLVGAHLDSVFTPGALDDASGLACLLELARVLAAQAGRAGPARSDIYFVCFGAEELGDLGSTRFVRTYRGPELGGMLELDTVGSGSTTMVYTRRGDSNAVAKAALAAAAAIGARAEAGASEGSDHVPFAEAGIPAAFLMREPETRYHSDADQVSAVSEDALVETLRIAAATTLGLAR
ncbi:MAG TPA: M28 family metallopeptidase, partial [Rectinemataceae bacterium]|nr:M28 family metallopeptidase [Rectinemataceae bacterium]